MTKNTDSAHTPRYVLKSGNQSVYPTISFDDPDTICVCVYGFSDKPSYDKFINSVEQLLTPYPLAKGYLANQIVVMDSTNTNGNRPGLVILDATAPAQPVLAAATMAAVLRALEGNEKQVPIEFELSFDPATSSYHIKKCDTKGTLPTEQKYIVR